MKPYSSANPEWLYNCKRIAEHSLAWSRYKQGEQRRKAVSSSLPVILPNNPVVNTEITNIDLAPQNPAPKQHRRLKSLLPQMKQIVKRSRLLNAKEEKIISNYINASVRCRVYPKKKKSYVEYQPIQ